MTELNRGPLYQQIIFIITMHARNRAPTACCKHCLLCVASTLISDVRTVLCAGSSAPLSSLHALFVHAFGDAVCNVCSWLSRGG
jgi:hypothetical protein